jgi:hypothetical protein
VEPVAYISHLSEISIIPTLLSKVSYLSIYLPSIYLSSFFHSVNPYRTCANQQKIECNFLLFLLHAVVVAVAVVAAAAYTAFFRVWDTDRRFLKFNEDNSNVYVVDAAEAIEGMYGGTFTSHLTQQQHNGVATPRILIYMREDYVNNIISQQQQQQQQQQQAFAQATDSSLSTSTTATTPTSS